VREVGEDAIRSRHELYALVLENVSDLIALSAADGRLLYASPSHERLLGWRPEELVGFDALARVHPDDARRVAAAFAAALGSGAAAVEPIRFQRRDGEWLVLESTLTALADRESGEALVLAVSRDVTAHRQAETAVRESRDLLDATLGAVTDAITVVAEDGRLVFANEPALRLLGYSSLVELLAASPDDVLGRFELLAPEGGPLPAERLPGRRVFAGEPAAEEHVLYRIRATGEERSSLVRAVPVRDEGGRVRLVISVFHDVTAERRAESDRRRLERITDAALTYLSLDELLNELLARLLELLAADTAAIFLLDAAGEALEVRATIGLEADHAGWRRVPLGKGFAGVVAERQEPLIVADARELQLVNPVLHDRGVRSLIGAPLVIEGRAIGVLRAGAVEVARFTGDDMRVLRLAADRIALAINQATLYEAAQASRARLEFLAEASDVLASSLDVEATLAAAAALVVPRIADLCAIHVLGDDGTIRSAAIVHADPQKAEWLRALTAEVPYDRDGPQSIPHVLRTGEAELFTEVTQERIARLTGERPEHEALLSYLSGASAITAPLTARGRTFGTVSFVAAESGRRYDEEDFAVAQELARRVAVAVDNARLYREAQERGRAARILESVGDGVFLVDDEGLVRYWNEAASSITGLEGADVLDRPARDGIPGWPVIGPLVPVGGPPQSIPLQLGKRETWLSISGVSVEEGTVYAFRDLTEERALEELRADFVSTVSHELRTPLAAIYGAAMTLRREDVQLDEAQRENLLAVVGSEADRLARTVNDILWASRLDSNTLRVAIETCDAGRLAGAVVAAQQAHLPANVALELAVDEVAGVAADSDKVRQVLVNLVDNAVKYSPEGGRVAVTVTQRGSHVRFAVADEGLGIPYADQRRIFEKFYRLDPQLTRGVGGTGLGLYISRELVQRMHGRIWVQSMPGRGSTFFVELPVAGGDADARV
jgi:PAS domain S-box-containing protein